jgi:hypothetical protein
MPIMKGVFNSFLEGFVGGFLARVFAKPILRLIAILFVAICVFDAFLGNWDGVWLLAFILGVNWVFHYFQNKAEVEKIAQQSATEEQQWEEGVAADERKNIEEEQIRARVRQESAAENNEVGR